LPEMSFAGQQDTYLNIIGEGALLKAVVDCWSSLWTARAIGYRARNGIDHADVALSVVVQEMVQASASGVLFTANPLTGARTETVIDATFGLGEALVGGYVEPDHYIIDIEGGEITSKTLGSKALTIIGKAEGGVIKIESNAAGKQALPDEQILALAKLGQRVVEISGSPQDIEWAWANERLYLLQSRPITSLFPLPDGMSPEPLRVMFSFGSVQGILEPLTPLGQDTIRLIFAGGGSLFGLNSTQETQGFIKIAGERLWGDITPAIRHPFGWKITPNFFSMIDPSILPVLNSLSNDQNLGAGTGHLRRSTLRRLAGFALPMIKRVLNYARFPEGKADQIHLDSQAEIARLRAQSEPLSGSNGTLEGRITLYRQIYNAFPYVVPNIASGAAAGLIPMILLNKIATHLTGSGDLALEITRGLPNNVTTEMDLALWGTAQAIRSDLNALHFMQNSPAHILACEYLEGQLPETAQVAISSFMERFGMRGIGEIDIGRPRWREHPTHIMQVLHSYLQIEDQFLAPDAVFQRGEVVANKAIAELEGLARKTFAGALKAKLIRAAARRVRCLAGLRESPKLHIIRMMGIIRGALLEGGQTLVASAVLEGEDDLFYLYLSELDALAKGDDRDWQALIAGRRASYEREMLRGQIPRLFLSDGRAFYDGISSPEAEGDTLHGSPVSPGVVEGYVRVVLDPQKTNLTPGEILVCPGTDPAWTPLFLVAAGLVMEIGGMVTHGAIVAREYGIPAVVGVHQATTRLTTGQRIQVNGSTGEVIILEES
ncbi:MAG: hypothetical protein KAI94_14040, partial [Anaerolineales bacterium]|nr:hypothetical protein [Anaerolineales bacterium]